MSSGEALPYELYERFRAALPQVTLINLYGSSEVAADVTCFDTNGTEPLGVVPIGRPIANVRIYVLDKNENPVPIGVPGEIYIGGDCLALGYLNRSELNAERFLTMRLGSATQERVYRTGDLGRYRRDGNIEFPEEQTDKSKSAVCGSSLAKSNRCWLHILPFIKRLWSPEM